MVPSGGNRIDMYDDPEFTYDLTYDRTSFVDHGAVVWGIVLMVGEWPPLDDAQRQINLRFTEFLDAGEQSGVGGEHRRLRCKLTNDLSATLPHVHVH